MRPIVSRPQHWKLNSLRCYFVCPVCWFSNRLANAKKLTCLVYFSTYKWVWKVKGPNFYHQHTLCMLTLNFRESFGKVWNMLFSFQVLGVFLYRGAMSPANLAPGDLSPINIQNWSSSIPQIQKELEVIIDKLVKAMKLRRPSLPYYFPGLFSRCLLDWKS